jgi:hypothetical protein
MDPEFGTGWQTLATNPIGQPIDLAGLTRHVQVAGERATPNPNHIRDGTHCNRKNEKVSQSTAVKAPD